MAQRLALPADRSDPLANPFANEERLAILETRTLPETPEARLRHRFALGRELLLAGRSRDAIDQLEALLRDIDSQAVEETLPLGQVREWLAIAYFRWAEQENCVTSTNPDSCVFPLRHRGIHDQKDGSRQALETYRQILEIQPENLTARWLLNLSAMTLGRHPEAVPEQWLLSGELLGPESGTTPFVERAAELGLAALGLAGGVVLEDLDGDGDLDAMVSSWGPRDPLRTFSNSGDGRFEDTTARAGLAGITGGLNLVHGDYDGDGIADIVVLRGAWLGQQGRQPNSLLRGRGDGSFEDVTESAGFLSFHPTQTAAWADYDQDGDLDLFVGNESLGSDIHPCELFRNEGDGTFSEIAGLLGLATTGFVKGVAWADFDGDGWPDLYVSRFLEANQLFMNPGHNATTFREVAALAGVEEPIHSFPVAVLDVDENGHPDLFVADYAPSFLEARSSAVVADLLGLPTEAEHSRLYLNQGNTGGVPRFSDASSSYGLDRVLLAMGLNVEDFDGDGATDIYVGTGAPDYRVLVPNRLFRNVGGQRFDDVTASARVGHLQKGHGVAFGDIDLDGDPDLLTVLGGAFAGDIYRNALFENPGGGGSRIVLQLEGEEPNVLAIGATVRIEVEMDDGFHVLHRRIGEGGSFGSSSLQLEVGLGTARSVRTVDVSWPSGDQTRYHNLPRGRSIRFRVHESHSPGDSPSAPDRQ